MVCFLFSSIIIVNQRLIFDILGTIVALLDLLFIYFVVPESLPERLRTGHKISCDKIDPFAVRNLLLFVSLEKIVNCYF